MSAEQNNHVLGGYKATLSNPNASEEAKKHAQEMLDKAGVDANAKANDTSNFTEEEKHQHHVIGGYKATLANANSSEEAKKHAQEMLDKLESEKKDSKESEKKEDSNKSDLKVPALTAEEKEKHRHRVEGGYKATLSNDKASDEAKKHAKEMLAKLEKGEELPESEKDEAHVIGGYKGVLTNPNSSEEAKANARQMLEAIGVDPEERASDNTSNLTEEEKHRHHVIGGYKATLANAHSSEEAKKHAQEMLDKLEKGEELPESEKRGLKRSSEDVAAEDKESAKGKQGFAAMPKEKVQEIASKGGRTLHAGEEPVPKKGKIDEVKSQAPSSAK